MAIKVELKEEEDSWEPRTVLTVKHNGKTVLEECDGGEPEDQSFYRDWNWVATALQDMYELGRIDSRKEYSLD